MLLLVDSQLGIWSLSLPGQARMIFDPTWGNINGTIIGPSDAMITERGTILIIHQTTKTSYLTEWNDINKSLRIIREIYPQVKNMECDMNGHMIFVLRDESMLCGPARGDARMKSLHPMYQTGIQIIKVSTDTNNIHFASTLHPIIGGCIHYDFDFLGSEKYWSEDLWLGELSDFALMKHQSIIIATNLTTCVSEYRKVKGSVLGYRTNTDLLLLEAKWNFPASNIQNIQISADNTIFASMTYGQEGRISVWQSIGDAMTWIRKGPNQSLDWNNAKIRAMDPIRTLPKYNWTLHSPLSQGDIDIFLAIRGFFSSEFRLPWLAISYVMAFVTMHMVPSHLAS
jgi:hypothetical protein